MQRLLIIGCGDVVRRVLPELVRRWKVFALVRQRDPALAALGVTQIPGDLDRRHSLRRLAGIADAVIHSAPPPPDGGTDRRTIRLLATLRQGRQMPRRVVYIGTTGVYGDCGGAQIDETRPLATATPRAQRRLDAERRLRRAASGRFRVSLLRAPGIYAADRLPLERLQKQLPLFRAEEDSHTNHIHALDLGRACIAALRHGRPNRAYNVCDDSALAMGEWFDLLAQAHALPKAPRKTRAEVQREVTPLQWSFMAESRRLSNARLKRELHFRLRYPTVAEGIRES